MPPSPIPQATSGSNQAPKDPAPEARLQKIRELPSFAEQVDAFAELRGYFKPDDDSHSYAAIQAYLASQITAEEAVNRIAEPIEEAYKSADHGRSLRKKEPHGDTVSEARTTEAYLRDLYFGILLAARRISWEKEGAEQEKLLQLVKTLKARADPQRSFELSELEDPNDWVLCDEALWSTLSMLGPSARESWNDCPGATALQDVEVQAWANVNAFVARLTRDGVADFWNYCIYAMRPAMEDENPGYLLDAHIPAAAAWVSVLGKQLHEKVQDLTPQSRLANAALPDIKKRRWIVWKKGFGLVGSGLDSRSHGVKAETTRLASETYVFMEGIARDIE